MTTQDSYFVGTFRIGARGQVLVPDESRTKAILISAGCDDVEPEGHGTAQARIPDEWAAKIEKDGGLRREIEVGSLTWTVDIDLP